MVFGSSEPHRNSHSVESVVEVVGEGNQLFPRPADSHSTTGTVGTVPEKLAENPLSGPLTLLIVP